MEDIPDLHYAMHTFICTCHKKALICEVDKFSEFTCYVKHRSKAALSSGLPQASHEDTLDGMLSCNLRVLQIKNLDPKADDLDTETKYSKSSYVDKKLANVTTKSS